MKTLFLGLIAVLLVTSARAGDCRIQLCSGVGARVLVDGLPAYESCGDSGAVYYGEAINAFNHLVSTGSCESFNSVRCKISNCKNGAMVEYDGGIMIDKCIDSLSPQAQSKAKAAAIKTFSSLISAGECQLNP